MEFVAVLFAQGAAFWLRSDAAAAVATVTGGLKMFIGDYRYVYGLNAMKGVRFIQDAAGGAMVVEFYLYRQPTTT